MSIYYMQTLEVVDKGENNLPGGVVYETNGLLPPRPIIPPLV